MYNSLVYILYNLALPSHILFLYMGINLAPGTSNVKKSFISESVLKSVSTEDVKLAVGTE